MDNKKLLRILLVDDSDTMRKLIRRILRQLEFQNITEAEDGIVAWEILQRTHIDLIISDWNMPRMTGLEFLRKVRESVKYAETPFLMVTAESMASNVMEAIEAGVSNYIVKPFNAHTLEAKIEAIYNSCLFVAHHRPAEPTVALDAEPLVVENEAASNS